MKSQEREKTKQDHQLSEGKVEPAAEESMEKEALLRNRDRGPVDDRASPKVDVLQHSSTVDELELAQMWMTGETRASEIFYPLIG